MTSIRRWISTFCAAFALVAIVAPFGAVSADDGVNYDDPNMVMTNDFAGDTATSCPHDMPPSELSRCLREKGLTAPQGVALGPSTQRDPKTR